MSARYKTTRVWPIPNAPIPLMVQDGVIFTISTYSHAPPALANRTMIRLCSVDVWIQNLVSHSELSIEIIVGMGNSRTILDPTILGSKEVPRLDLDQPYLTPHQPWYGIRSGCSAFTGVVYAEDLYHGGLVGFPIEWERPVMGVCRNRRPLRLRYRKEERPCMHLANDANCPTIWGRPHFSPPTTRLQAEIMGMVTFESDQ
jgi:hypothetical protein